MATQSGEQIWYLEVKFIIFVFKTPIHQLPGSTYPLRGTSSKPFRPFWPTQVEIANLLCCHYYKALHTSKNAEGHTLHIHWSWLCKIDVSLNQLMFFTFFKIQLTISAICWHIHEPKFTSPFSGFQTYKSLFIAGRIINTCRYYTWSIFQHARVDCQRVI